MNATKIIGILGIATLLGACGGAADEMLAGLDESQITTSISCANTLNALEMKPDHGGGRAPSAVDATVPDHGGGREAAPSEVESISPDHGGGREAAPSEVESISPDHGGGRAPLMLALSSDLDCSSYNVEIIGTDVDGEAVVMSGEGIDAAVEVTDGTFVHTFNTPTLGEIAIENM